MTEKKVPGNERAMNDEISFQESGFRWVNEIYRKNQRQLTLEEEGTPEARMNS